MLRNKRAVEEVLESSLYEIREVDVSNLTGSIKDLREILADAPQDSTIHIASFNTKLSCLAVWALWLENSGIRIWNARPKTYNVLAYSGGSAPPRYFSVGW